MALIHGRKYSSAFACFGILTNSLLGSSVYSEESQNALRLKMITETANQICQSAPLEQTSSGLELSGDAKAKVGGIVGKFADLGFSGATNYQNSHSIGVLQKDLVLAIQSGNDCKLQVLQLLERDLFGTESNKAYQKATSDLECGSPPAKYLKDPTLAPMQSKTKTGDGSLIGVHEIGLYGCTNGTKMIDCYLTETRLSQGSGDYRIDDLFGSDTKLIDELHQNHNKTRASWINGKGNPQPVMNVSSGDSVWFLIQFANPDPDTTKARIDFRAFKGGSLQGEIASCVDQK